MTLPSASALSLAVLLPSLLCATARADQPTANPSATPAAKALLNWLSGLKDRPDNRVVSGQYIGTSKWSVSTAWSRFYDTIYEQTSRTANVGLIGIEFEAGWELPAASNGVLCDQSWVDKAVGHAGQGGMVTVNWHPHNPWTGGDVFDRGGTGASALDELIDSTSGVYPTWMAKLDAMADCLAVFRNAGVVVLWRPLHEMNGWWFWWGTDNDDASYVRLWRHMFDRFTSAKGLDNLLWVYAPNEGGGALDRYPGDDAVDVCAVDYYPTTVSFGTMAAYTALATKGKVMAMSEYGYRGDRVNSPLDNVLVIESIKNDNRLMTYVMYWSDDSDLPYAMVSSANTAGFMSHPWIVNRGEIGGGAVDATPSIPANLRVR